MCDCFYLGPPVRRPPLPPPPGADPTSKAWPQEPTGSHAPNPIDVHAHPGRCFLRGLAATDPLVRSLGADAAEQAIAEIKAGGLSAVVFSTVADLRVLRPDASGGLAAGRSFESGEAYADHRRQLGALKELGAREDVQLVLEPGDLSSDEVGLIIGCEGGDFLEGRVDRVEEASRDGVRTITLVHYRINEIGDIQTEPPVHGGLSPFGVDVVREMNRAGIVIDLAHATRDVTKQVLDVSDKPVMISHSHLATGGDSHPRLLSLEHARLVSTNGGLVGAWPAGVALETFDDYLDEILRMIDQLGVDHVAVGTDMDANYKPVVTSYLEFPSIEVGLSERGLSATELEAVMGGNFVRVFTACRG